MLKSVHSLLKFWQKLNLCKLISFHFQFSEFQIFIIRSLIFVEEHTFVNQTWLHLSIYQREASSLTHSSSDCIYRDSTEIAKVLVIQYSSD